MHDGAPPRERPGGPAGSRPCGRPSAEASAPYGQTSHRQAPRGQAPDPPASDPSAADPPAPDLQALARDWITLWQSELTAAAADRELQETWQTLAGLWAGVAGAMLAGLPRGAPDGPSRHAAPPGAGAAAAARPAPVAAAPDPRDAEIDRLAGRIAELERRLSELERNGGR